MKNYRIYTKENLEKINPVYLSDHSHRIEQSDVNFANDCIKMMCNGLNSKIPKKGDVVQYTTREGIYYPHAHIDSIENGIASVCLVPFVPFVFIRNDKIEMESVSGGPWVQIEVSALKKTGVESKMFRFFGSSGVCAYGAIDFEGYADCWEYKEDGLRFGEYSTKSYCRTVFRKYDNQWHITESSDLENVATNFTYSSKSFLLEMNRWLKETRGVQFGNFDKDDVVTVFTYKESHHLVSLEFWNSLELPTSMRRINGKSQVCVKLGVNDKTKSVAVYRYANN